MSNKDISAHKKSICLRRKLKKVKIERYMKFWANG